MLIFISQHTPSTVYVVPIDRRHTLHCSECILDSAKLRFFQKFWKTRLKTNMESNVFIHTALVMLINLKNATLIYIYLRIVEYVYANLIIVKFAYKFAYKSSTDTNFRPGI